MMEEERPAKRSGDPAIDEGEGPALAPTATTEKRSKRGPHTLRDYMLAPPVEGDSYDHRLLSRFLLNTFGYGVPSISAFLLGSYTVLSPTPQGTDAFRAELPFELVRNAAEPGTPVQVVQLVGGRHVAVTLKMIDIGAGQKLDLNKIIPQMKLHCGGSSNVFRTTQGTYDVEYGVPVGKSPLPCLRWLAYTDGYQYYETDEEAWGGKLVVRTVRGHFLVACTSTSPAGLSLRDYRRAVFNGSNTEYAAFADTGEIPHPLHNTLVLMQLMCGVLYGVQRLHEAGVAMVDFNADDVWIGRPDTFSEAETGVTTLVGVSLPRSQIIPLRRLVLNPIPSVTFLELGASSCSKVWNREVGRMVDTCTFEQRRSTHEMPAMAPPELLAGAATAPPTLNQLRQSDIYTVGARLLVYLMQGVKPNADIGVTLRAIQTGAVAGINYTYFTGPSNTEYLERLTGLRSDGDLFPATMDVLVQSLLDPMLAVDPGRRPTASQACDILEGLVRNALEMAGVVVPPELQKPSTLLGRTVATTYAGIMKRTISQHDWKGQSMALAVPAISVPKMYKVGLGGGM